MLDDFETEVEALMAVSELIVVNEPNIVDGMTLLRIGGPGGGAEVAGGADLANRARAASAQGRRSA
jgi:hypothetical protein